MTKVIDSFLYWLTRDKPCKRIDIDGARYLERYFLFYAFGFEWVLHRYLGGDTDRSPHDHPANSFSIILSGGYIEEVVEYLTPRYGWKSCDVKKRWFNSVPANKFHIVKQIKPRTWTLFIFGPPVEYDGLKKGWGFLRKHPGTIGVFYEEGPSSGKGWAGIGNRLAVGGAHKNYWDYLKS